MKIVSNGHPDLTEDRRSRLATKACHFEHTAPVSQTTTQVAVMCKTEDCPADFSRSAGRQDSTNHRPLSLFNPWRLPFKIIKFPMPETELVYKRHCFNKRMKLDHDAGFASGPFMFTSHEVTFPKQGLEQLTKCQLSRSQTAKQPNQMQELIRPKGIQTIHFGARRQLGTF